jgi:hypothetical protein
MDEVSYLSVLISVILGLAVAQVLKGFREILLSRARIMRRMGSGRSYFPIESLAGSLPESLAARHLVPLLPRLRPRSAYYNLCVIDK